MAKKTNNILEKLDLKIDEEKIALINFYLKEEGDNSLDISAELSQVINDHIEKLYKRKVPKSVRHYIENKDKEDNENEHRAESSPVSVSNDDSSSQN